MPRPRLRAPRGRRPPRREARQPALRGGDGRHEARRLRHREGRRADTDHAGRIRARDGRLPVTGAGARRGGRPVVRHLLARCVRLPVPDGAASARVRVADRAGAEAAAGPGRAGRGLPAGGAARARRGGAGCARARSGCPLLERPGDGRGHRGGRARRGDRCHAAARDERLRRDRGDRPDRGHERDAAHLPRPVADARARHPALGHPAPARVAGRARRRAARAAGRRRFGGFLALLAAIAAIAVVAIALLSSSSSGGVDPVDTGELQQQIDGLRDFISEHSR